MGYSENPLGNLWAVMRDSMLDLLEVPLRAPCSREEAPTRPRRAPERAPRRPQDGQQKHVTHKARARDWSTDRFGLLSKPS